MNRDISQLITLLAGMQGDLASLRTGLAALEKEVQNLASRVHAGNPDEIERSARTGAGEGAAKEVARAANSASSAAQSVQAVAAMAVSTIRWKRRWKAATLALAAALVFGAGFSSSVLVGVWNRYGCLAHGGEWMAHPTVTACAFR